MDEKIWSKMTDAEKIEHLRRRVDAECNAGNDLAKRLVDAEELIDRIMEMIRYGIANADDIKEVINEWEERQD